MADCEALSSETSSRLLQDLSQWDKYAVPIFWNQLLEVRSFTQMSQNICHIRRIDAAANKPTLKSQIKHHQKKSLDASICLNYSVSYEWLMCSWACLYKD